MNRYRTAAACFACLTLQACDTFGLHVDAGLARLSLDGDVALAPAGAGSGGLANNDVDDSLGLDSFSGSPYVRLQLRYEKTSVTFSTLYYSESGSGRLGPGFGEIMPGQIVSSEADILSVKSAVHYDLIEAGPVRISPGIGVDFLDVDIVAQSGGISSALDTSIPTPMVYLQTEVDMGAFQAVVDVGAFQMDMFDFDGTVLDVDAMLRWGPLPLVEVFGGYRAIYFDGDGDSRGRAYSTDLLLHGWIVGVKVPF